MRSSCRALLLTALIVSHGAAAPTRARHIHGFSTLLPMTFGPDADQAADGLRSYGATPSVAVPHIGSAPHRTAEGLLADDACCVFGGCGPADDPAFLPARTIDPHTGAAIGAFGPAYMDASPVGHGLASHEQNTVGYGP